MASETVTTPSNASSKLHQYSGKGRRGRKSLERLPDMPLDVVVEIFCLLTPQDLLHLGRSSKTLRALIFSKHYCFLWRAARQQVEGLPPKPRFLSEPQYANLLFDHHCHNCLRSNVKSIIWKFLARYCNDCKFKMTTDEGIPDELLAITHPKPGGILGNPLPFFLTRPRARYRGPVVTRFHAIDVMTLRAALEGAVNAEQKQKIINDRRELTSEIEQFGGECQLWINDTKLNRLDELAAIKIRRYEAIINRLTALGWGKDIEYMRDNYLSRDLQKHALVKQPKDLTDRTWAKICPQILVVMEGVRSKRLLALHSKAIRSRFETLKVLMSAYHRAGGFKGTGGFTAATLANFPEVRDVLTVSPDIELSLKELHLRLGPQIPGFVARWRTQMEEQLSESVSSHVDVSKDISPLDLAIAVFQCTVCRKFQRFPDVLDHDCPRPVLLLAPFGTMASTLDVELLYAHEAKRILGCPRSSTCYSFQSSSVIKMTGKVSGSTTAADMDELGTKLKYCCVNCHFKQLAWRNAIDHWDHFLMFELEGSTNTERSVQMYGFRCLQCQPSTEWDSRAKVISHLQSFHQKSDPVQHEDFGFDYSALESDFKVPSELTAASLKHSLRGNITLDLSFEDQQAVFALSFAEQCAYLYNIRY